MSQLEDELRTTREELQGTIEELESSNEELKASNEEMMSLNEELQSVNEELETSKEELQSTNEELHTVNNQLNQKMLENKRAADQVNEARLYAENIVATVREPLVVLDGSLRARSANPSFYKSFRLRAEDRWSTGRSSRFRVGVGTFPTCGPCSKRCFRTQPTSSILSLHCHSKTRACGPCS